MRLYPTQAAFHLSLSGAAVLSLGLATRTPAIVAYGGAMLLALAIGRAFSRLSILRLRSAGFEMTWLAKKRVVRTTHGSEITVIAELRNRGDEQIRAVQIRPIASSMLSARITPDAIDVPARSAAQVTIHLTASRVGRWGVHGLALEARGSLGGSETVYEAPLMFAAPFGVEVLPRVGRAVLGPFVGGRSRRAAEAGRPARSPGEGDEIRELRDHMTGDPFKRIAWKASAKRGRLLVRAMDRNERDVVWLVVDASVDLWAGPVGKAPLDRTIDEVASLATRYVARGDRVGFVVCASRLRTWLSPSADKNQVSSILFALASAASLVDEDRCDLDELEIAQRVTEHARPLDPRFFGRVKKGDLDAIAARASHLRSRAPFAPRVPFARSPREQALRHYLAAFGIEVPPRAEGEHDRCHQALVPLFDRMLRDRARPTQLHVFSPAPSPSSSILPALQRLRRKRIAITWSLPGFTDQDAEKLDLGRPILDVEDAVDQAIRLRIGASRARGELLLRTLGIRARRAS